MCRRPPTSTLFPYTSSSDLCDALVIRVLADGRPVAAQRKLVSRVALIGLVASGCFYTVDTVNQRPSLGIVQSPGPYYRGAIDRKSTRLKPSHLGLSYAVFRL